MLMVTFESKWSNKMFSFPIKRDEKNNMILDIDEIQEQEGISEGRFANFYGNKK